MFTRKAYQSGSLKKLPRRRGPAVWEFRYRDHSLPNSPQRQITFGTDAFPTRAAARRHLEALLWKINSDNPQNIVNEFSFDGLCDLYIKDEHLREISKLKRGDRNIFGLKVSTGTSYLQIIEGHLRPKWGNAALTRITPAKVQEWFNGMECSPATKAHRKAVLFRLFERAMLWELLPIQRNPIELVEIKGGSKRRKRPTILTTEQVEHILGSLQQPYRTMILVAACLGLRVSEILALQWKDFDFERRSIKVSRAVVRGVVDRVKTDYSEDELPLAPEFVESLREWEKDCPPSTDGWCFPSPVTQRPYEPGSIQQKVIRVEGQKIGVPNLGWHSFRHTYRSLLDAVGAPMGVQQRLMRHAQIATTMDRYGNAQMQAQRESNGKLVRMILKGSAGFCEVEQSSAQAVAS